MPDLFQIKRAILDLAGKIEDIFRLAEPADMTVFASTVPSASRIRFQMVVWALVDICGKQVGVGLTADRTDLIDQRAQSGVFLF